MGKELDAVFARAEAAIAEAAQLMAANCYWRTQVQRAVTLRQTGVQFSPKTLKVYSPTDFPGPIMPPRVTM